jgi:hypothetical protein
MADSETVCVSAFNLLGHTSFSVVADPQRTKCFTLPVGYSLRPRLACNLKALTATVGTEYLA